MNPNNYEYLKSMVDHPAGKGRHRTDLPQVGYANPDRDAAPNPNLFDGLFLAAMLILGTLFAATLIIAQLWHALGLFGAVLGVLIVANIAWIVKDHIL